MRSRDATGGGGVGGTEDERATMGVKEPVVSPWNASGCTPRACKAGTRGKCARVPGTQATRRPANRLCGAPVVKRC